MLTLTRGKPPLPAAICATPAMAKRWFNSSMLGDACVMAIPQF
jgi:hypothetical protein